MADDALIETIDSAAARLLEMAGFGVTVEGAEPSKATLPEQVKAFEAVVEWAKTRPTIRSAEKGKSKFDGIREQFSATRKRRGSSSIAAVEDNPAVDPPEPVAAPAANLFDA
jgi:hypothetical protein